jgi:hypothetical protein
MVNRAVFNVILTGLVISGGLHSQTAGDLERRVAELEQKMRLIDPAFGEGNRAIDLAGRLAALESKMQELLPARPAAAQAAEPSPAQPQPAPSQPAQAVAPVTTVSVSGDYQASPESETRLPVAGYMDFHVNRDSGQSFRPDFHRFVLLFGHSFSDRIKFWSELEVEHSLIEGGESTGEVALEQAFVDFLIKPWFNLRAGMMLTPVGIVNERHEPPAFNGVERPFVETLIIPSTWRELGAGATGDLGRGFRYRAYLTSALDANGFDAGEGIAGGRTHGFEASFRNPAKVARLEYAGVRRMTLGISAYSGHAGFNSPGINPRVTIGELDARYSFRRLDFRGLFANTWITRVAELNRHIQLQTGVNPNIARQMRGYYFEPAVHVLPRSLRHDLIVFGRYEKYNTQHRMPEGYVPLRQFNRSSWIGGVTFKPNADVAIKFDYVVNRNRSSVVAPLNGVNFGVGWWF